MIIRIVKAVGRLIMVWCKDDIADNDFKRTERTGIMLYREYDSETLKKLQTLELEILRDFNDLCDKYDIDYFGCGGTAIGAVRHGGFIPWDDDIDIGFLRKDYEKFLKVAEKEYGNKYSILNAEVDPGYPLMTSRWVLNGTSFKEECFKELDCNFGIFLDLFCFDNIPDDTKKMKKQMWRGWFWGKLMILLAIKKPTVYQQGITQKVIYFISYVMHYALKLFHVSPEYLYKKAKKYATYYEEEKTKRVAFMFDPTPFTSIMNVEDVLPTKSMDYSGIKIRVPNHIEKYLEVRYGGNYMELPPEEKRHNHPPYDLDFGDY